jgi:hypothetical protein
LPNQIIQYFTLERPAFGKAGVISDAILFTGVLAGVIGQVAIAALTSGHLEWVTLITGLITSFAIYPAIYHNAGLNQSNKTFVRWCVAFQNGYFWPTLFAQVAQGYNTAGMISTFAHSLQLLGFS